MRPLNPRQLRFVAGYLDGLPASAAYRAAGYRCRTARSAEAKASALLRTPAVTAAVGAEWAAAAARAAVSAERVVAGLLAEATYFGPGTSHAARVAAWVALGRHLGLFKDTVEVGGRPAAPTVRLYLPNNGRDPVRLRVVEELVDAPAGGLTLEAACP